MLRQIKYFQAVVKHNSFSEAAYECNISQSAISQQIQALERELGFPLFIRKKRKFELTPAGEFFYKKSLVLIADYEQIVRETTRLAGGNPMSSLDKVTVQELKNMPCILVSSEAEKETEAEYYHMIVGLQGEKLFADNMEEARTLVISGKGFMPSEGAPIEGSLGTNIVRIPLYCGNEPMKRNYCAFWKKENAKKMSEEFVEILRRKFEV